ncbi:MAG: hypothetical protein K2X77_15970, partial [Candidatus Obscuribacterales bacterium]|nr:hypothetical protein [Candidatus Obscuribacterales bacterium]
MNAPSKSGFAGLLRFALIEVLVVLIGIVFVRREVYLGGHFGEMVLHWQEYAILGLSFIDGMVRGQTRALYSSPFRKKVLRYFLPFALFLYVACASLCDKLNVGCLREEWFRDLGLFIMGGGVILLIVAQRSRPRALLTSQFGVASETLAISEANPLALPGANQDSIPEIEQSSSELQAESEAGETPALPGANQDAIPEIEQSSSELQAESEAGETPALPG